MKLFGDNSSLPDKTTRLKSLHTRSEIDGLVAKCESKTLLALGSWSPQTSHLQHLWQVPAKLRFAVWLIVFNLHFVRFKIVINATTRISVRIVNAGNSGIVGEGDNEGVLVGNLVELVLGLLVGLGDGVRFGEAVVC